MANLFIGIDNGVTGAIAFIASGIASLYSIPTKSEYSYTKKKQKITRIDFEELYLIMSNNINSRDIVFCLIERPMVNPMRFKATVSALRALESTQIVLENLDIPYQFIDSKEWQKKMLPSGLGKEELKEASLQVAKRLFPKLKIDKKIADAILIAEYARRQYK